MWFQIIFRTKIEKVYQVVILRKLMQWMKSDKIWRWSKAKAGECKHIRIHVLVWFHSINFLMWAVIIVFVLCPHLYHVISVCFGDCQCVCVCVCVCECVCVCVCLCICVFNVPSMVTFNLKCEICGMGGLFDWLFVLILSLLMEFNYNTSSLLLQVSMQQCCYLVHIVGNQRI